MAPIEKAVRVGGEQSKWADDKRLGLFSLVNIETMSSFGGIARITPRGLGG